MLQNNAGLSETNYIYIYIYIYIYKLLEDLFPPFEDICDIKYPLFISMVKIRSTFPQRNLE